MDELDRLTDAELEKLEKKIEKLYKEASAELTQIITDYFAKFQGRDAAMRALLENGEINEQEYRNWRLAQIGRGKRFETLRDELAERMVKADEVAMAYVNDATPSVYSLNMNYMAYNIEKSYGNIGLTAWNDEAVRLLAIEEPDLMPYYPEKKAVNRGIDLDYGKKQITAQVTSSILLGDSIPKIADKLQNRIETMSRVSAVRAARTAVTAAQNGGRQATFERAAAMGIKVRRRWIATKDLRTRPEHGHADGQIVEVDKPFTVGGEKLMFPGDRRTASGWNIYNCRCSVGSVEKEGIEAEPTQIRVRNPITGRNELVNEMTYNEWYKWKKELEKPIENAILASVGNNRPRNRSLEKAIRKSILAERPIFCDGRLAVYAKKIIKDVDYYDAVLHGTPKTAEIFKETIPPHILANILKARKDYTGQNIRLLSCSTGVKDEKGNCFAQELANLLGVTIIAPNNKLWVHPGGKITIGDTAKKHTGEFVTFTPKEE